MPRAHLGVDPLLGLGLELEHGRRAGEVAVRGDLDRVVRRRAVPVRQAGLSKKKGITRFQVLM